MSEEERAVPQQKTGVQTDVTYDITSDNIDDAKRLFATAKQRLLDVNDWENVCGKASANFQLMDPRGQHVSRHAQRGDKFRIDIPAPGTKAGDGYDWVEVEEILETSDDASDSQHVAMRVRPCPNPLTPPQENDTAHFYTDEATSTFTVIRNGVRVSAEVHGRNEKPNTEASGLLDKARNALVAVGAIAGLHKPQWNALVKGLLKTET